MSGPICENCGQDSVLYKEPERIIDLERQLAEAQGKLAYMERLTYDLHRQNGHPDPACLRCGFYDVLKKGNE